MRRLEVSGRTDRSVAVRLGVLSAVLLTLAAWTHARPVATPDSPDLASTIPFAFGDWAGRDAPALDPDVAQALAADQYVHRFYGLRSTRFTERVEIDVAYYERPQASAAMHSPLNCLPGNGWQVVESRTTPVRVDDQTWRVRRLVVDRKGYRIAMAYWFQNRGAVVAHEFQQRLRLLTSGLHGRPTDAALVRVMALDTESGRRLLDDFTPRVMKAVAAAFAQRPRLAARSPFRHGLPALRTQKGPAKSRPNHESRITNQEFPTLTMRFRTSSLISMVIFSFALVI